MRARLEAMPQWVRLGDDDRAEIVERIAAPREAVPATTGLPSTRYRTLLGLLARQPKLEADLAGEIRARSAEETTDSDRVVHVRAEELIPYAVLRPEIVDRWLAGIRERTTEYFASADEIHVEERDG